MIEVSDFNTFSHLGIYESINDTNVSGILEDFEVSNYTMPTGPWYWPWCSAWKPAQHPIFQISSVLFVASYCSPNTKKGQLWMHMLLIFAFLVYSVWSWHVICAPDAFTWNFAFVLLNLGQVVFIVYQMRPVKFDPELEEVYHTLFEPFKVTRFQFKKMVSPEIAVTMSLHAGEAYALQNLTKTDRLGLLLSGKVNVMSGHQFLHPILPCEFLDSPEFESSRATIDEKFKVSIVAASSCRYVYWQRTSLEYLFAKETYLATVMTTLIARDITTKLYAMNCKIFTEKGTHLDIRLPTISHALVKSPRRTIQTHPKPQQNCWPASPETLSTSGGGNWRPDQEAMDEELMPLAAHEEPAAHGDAPGDVLSDEDNSAGDSCPDTSSKYHSCEAVETDDELKH